MQINRSVFRRWTPWGGQPTRWDVVLLAAIGAVLLLGAVVRPLTPFLIARHPILLELLTGDLAAVGVGAAFARIGELPLGAVIGAGVVGMIKFDALAWWAGRRWGGGMLRMVGSPAQATRWAAMVRRTRPWVLRLAVLGATLPGVPSAVVFVLAGMSGMRLVLFLLLDAGGALVMTTIIALLGFGVGQSAVDIALAVDSYASAVSIALIVIALVVPLAKRRIARLAKRHPRRRAHDAPRNRRCSAP